MILRCRTLRVTTFGALLLLTPGILRAQAADTTLSVRFGGFADFYYAWDSGQPRSLDRGYTTTAARHAEFNVNLAHVEATLRGPRVRGRLALQVGTSVQANYAGEPRIGAYSGPDVSRFIQEATVGYQVAEDWWLDGGVFFAPFGAEAWISRDNLTYTRSLIADYSPYYESGVRATWTPSSRFSAQFHVINGWQNISETNTDKAIAVRADWTPHPRLVLTYDTFIGNEQPDSLPARTRQFHEVIAQWTPDSVWTVRLSVDVGREARVGPGHAWWRGGALIVRRALTSSIAAVGRAEFYSDPERAIMTGPGPMGPRIRGGSVGVDVTPVPRVLWRSEWRQLRAEDAIFSDRAGPSGLGRGNGVLVSSLALTF